MSSKKNISLALLTLLILILGFTVLQNIVLLVHQSLERDNISQNIVLKLSKEEWAGTNTNNPKEVSINNHLFDIERIDIQDNYVELTGHFDEKEDQMRLQLKEWNKRGSSYISLMSFFFLDTISAYSIPFKEIVYSKYHLINTEKHRCIFLILNYLHQIIYLKNFNNYHLSLDDTFVSFLMII